MRRIVLAVLAILTMGSVAVLGGFSERAWAQKCVETSVLGSGGQYCWDENEEGGGTGKLLNLVIKIMVYAIGALGAVGIVIAGIQYLTAGGNEAQVTKAKNRLIQVVIGLIAYGLMATVLNFLIPGGVF